MSDDRIRVRAYFDFENHTGAHWADPVSNWLQAEQEESAASNQLTVGPVTTQQGLTTSEQLS